MKFNSQLKEMSCEELENKRSQIATFVFSSYRNIDSELMSVSIDKLTSIENEIEYRKNVLQDMINDPQDLTIIDWEDLIKESVESFYK